LLKNIRKQEKTTTKSPIEGFF